MPYLAPTLCEVIFARSAHSDAEHGNEKRVDLLEWCLVGWLCLCDRSARLKSWLIDSLCKVSDLERSRYKNVSSQGLDRMWVPYQDRNGGLPDFLVEYRFYTPDEGGRQSRPFQGYRSDLHYEGEDINEDGIYRIWPEFLNRDGSVIKDGNIQIPEAGRTYVWMFSLNERWEYHARNARPGRKCWFIEVSRKVAEAKIVEQIALVHHIDQAKS
jgi:hypothetical protein